MHRRTIAASVMLVFTTLPALAGVKLPLKNGEYLQDSCAQYDKFQQTKDYNDAPDSAHTIWIFAEAKKPLTISPAREQLPSGKDAPSGYCDIKKIKVTGDVYSGAGRCTEGVMENYTGTYRFSYQVISPEKFMSKGKTFIWCADYKWGRH